MSLDVSVYEVLRDWLRADAAIEAIVATRIRPGSLPRGSAFPALVFKRVGGDDMEQVHGEPGQESGASVGWVRATFQTEAWASDIKTSDALGTALAKRLRRLTGSTHMGMRFGVVRRVGDYSAQAPSLSAEVRIQDFEIPHFE